MSVLVTPDEMRAAEAAAVAAGRSEPELMRAAAGQIAAWVDMHVERRAHARRFAVALIGPGNNGGDALVALALLIKRGWRCAALLLGRYSFGTLPASFDLLEQIQLTTTESLDAADIILDGVYGVSGRASLPDAVAAAFRRAYQIRIDRGTPLVAIDVPSGVDPACGAASPDAFHADVTLCLGLPKIGLIREPAATHVGELEILDVGVEPLPAGDRPRLIDELAVRRLLPRRRASAHKHQTGSVLVIGGAPTYYGAPRLSAEAAARAGAGLVCVAAPATIIPVIAAQVPELVLLPLGDSAQTSVTHISEWVEQRGGHVDALIVGPGLGQSSHANELLEQLFSESSGFHCSSDREASAPYVVLDADALNWFAKRGTLPAGIASGRAVLTPHAGELGRLLSRSATDILSDPISHAKDAVDRFQQTVVLKSGYSVVASIDGSVSIAPRAVPELATAGTGDVLAGLIGGLMAQGLEPADAARAAVFVGAQAGLAARQRRGVHGVLARDVIDCIPAVMRRLTEPNLTCGVL